MCYLFHLQNWMKNHALNTSSWKDFFDISSFIPFVNFFSWYTRKLKEDIIFIEPTLAKLYAILFLLALSSGGINWSSILVKVVKLLSSVIMLIPILYPKVLSIEKSYSSHSQINSKVTFGRTNPKTFNECFPKHKTNYSAISILHISFQFEHH